MTTYTLTTFHDGDTLLADEINDNFQYCLADTTTKVDALSSTVSSGYVKTTTAQSIAGSKTFTDIPTVSNSPSYLYLKNPDIDLGSTPGANKYCGVVFKDKDGESIGQVYHRRQADKTIASILTCVDKNGSNNVSIQVGYDASGNAISAAPTCTNDGAILTLAGVSIDQNKGYIKLKTGLKIQWGASESATSGYQTVSLPTSFASSNYYAAANLIRSNTSGNGYGYIADRHTSYFKAVVDNGEAFTWVAIGY